MDSLQKEKDELIEMFGIHFESVYNIPPLAARIVGLLIVEGCKSGLTFENIVEKLGASKSSISTNLNLLLKMEKIYYFTIPCDRKKYFKSAPLSSRLLNYLKILESEFIVTERILNYREKTASCSEEKCNLENIKSYKKHLLEVEKSLKKTIAEFKKIEIQNQSQN
ncbi:GbsR/MarR family transcriptional regulator [Flavobacterium daejeonense]|uniref:GbsR/MarR family transcriptional regulator n=1 Tax=Flavobacterium daejeonense TaxID=350893 RepID=UPI00047B947D|nr:hypothetical protein [Flavobacterium daejeonense]